VDICRGEEAFDSERSEVREGWLIQQSRIHYAVRCQLLDYHVEELVLVRREGTPLDEPVQSLLCSSSIEPDQRSDEQAEAALLAN